MNQQISAEEYEIIISGIKNEVEFIRNNYEVPLNILDNWIDKLFICDPNEVTTPFSGDLGLEPTLGGIDRDYSRELGEVHDTFNVVIQQGNGNPITLTRQVVRYSKDDGSYLQSMVDVLSKLKNNK